MQCASLLVGQAGAAEGRLAIWAAQTGLAESPQRGWTDAGRDRGGGRPCRRRRRGEDAPALRAGLLLSDSVLPRGSDRPARVLSSQWHPPASQSPRPPSGPNTPINHWVKIPGLLALSNRCFVGNYLKL